MDAFCWSSPPPTELVTPHLVLALVDATATSIGYRAMCDGAALGTVTMTVEAGRIGALACDVTFYAFEAIAAISELAARTSQLLQLELCCTDLERVEIARQAGFVRAGGARWLADCDDLIAWHHVRHVAAEGAEVSVAGDAAVLSVLASDGVPLELSIEHADDQRYVTATTPIGREDQFSASESLHHTNRLVVGALTIDDKQLTLRYGCSPSGFTASCLALLLREAARLRALFTLPTIHTDAFSCAL
jgi:hypothetical protein